MPKQRRIAGIVFFLLCSVLAHGAELRLPAVEARAASGVPASNIPAATAPVEDNTSGGLHFRIVRYRISGNTLIDGATLQTIVQPYTGEDRDFDTIQSAVDTIYAAYNNAGYQTVRVIIPEQALEDGIVKLRVIESKLRNIGVQGNRYHGNDNVLNTLSNIKLGQIPNSKDVEENLRLANENYSKQTQVTFRATDKEGEAEGIARVMDKEPGRAAMLLDNTGTKPTGQYRLGLLYQNANVLNRDHQFSLMYQTSPNHLSKVRIASSQYRIPLYDWGAIMELGAGYSNVNSGLIATAAGNYTVAGSGRSYSGRFIKLLPRIGKFDQRANLGMEERVFNNNVNFAGTTTSLVPNIVLHPWSLGYDGTVRDTGTEWSLGFSREMNRPSGKDSDAAAFALPGQRFGANPKYILWRYNLAYSTAFSDNWLMRFQFNGQQTRDALVSGAQFGVGGMESVRGFNERELADDQGKRATLEIQTPNLSLLDGSIWSGTKALWFYDAANLKHNKALLGEALSHNIASTGLGLRTALGKQGMARLDFADVLRGDGVRKKGSKMIHAGMSYLF